MGGTAAIVLITAALCVGGNDVAAGPRADAAAAADGTELAAQAKPARRRRAKTRRAPSSGTRSAKRQRSADPSSQPAHMAPQLEDIPPVTPPPTVPPKPDKRNPV